MTNIKFGTSGFRGIIGDNWTREVVQRIGRALSRLVGSNGKVLGGNSNFHKGEAVRVVVGFDSRFMGRESAEWFCESLGAGFDVTMFEVPVPTPVITYGAVGDFDFGVMMTASHNPYQYNGIKVFLSGGKEAGDEFFGELSKYLSEQEEGEKLLRVQVPLRRSGTPSRPANSNQSQVRQGVVVDSPRLSQRDLHSQEFFASSPIVYTRDTSAYRDKVLSALTNSKKIGRMRVLFNAMHGSSAGLVCEILDRLGVKYEVENAKPDAYFGGKVPAPYVYSLTAQAKRVVDEGFDLGFALDGDGDRVAFIDSDGSFWDCNYLMALLWRGGPLAKNHFSSSLAKKLVEKRGEKVFETAVGFKHLGKVLEETNACIAGESTGIAFKDISLAKDGIYTTFLLLDTLAREGKSIREMVGDIIKEVDFPTHYIEQAYISHSQPKPDVPELGMRVEDIIRFPEGHKICLENGYWAGVRQSGNEPVARIYVEMPCKKTAEAVQKKLEDFYGLKERQK